MTAPRSLAFAARLPSGKVLIAGGNPAVSSTDIYDPTINSFTVGPSMVFRGNLPRERNCPAAESSSRAAKTATLLSAPRISMIP